MKQDIVRRCRGNPILTRAAIPYPVETVHNAAVVKHGDEYVMLFRSHLRTGRSIIGLARSPDGFQFTADPEPFLTPARDSPFAAYEEFGVEDPRVTRLEGEYLITYSTYSRNGVRVALAKTRDFNQVERVSLITQADHRNVVIFPEKFDGLYARLDRPHSEIAPWSIWISYSPDLRFWGQSQLIMRPEQYHWDEMKIGPGAPPIKTELMEEPAAEPGYSLAPQPALVVCDPPSPYRPRHPEFTVFYQVFEQHFDKYAEACEERFEPQSGPLRRVVRPTVEQFLSCGRLQGGFARIRCPKCRAEHLLAFSCRTRNFCSSCQAKRAVLFAEKLTSEILAPVTHRHWAFSIPRALRGLFERERKLLGLLSRTGYEAIHKSFQALFDRKDVRPGCVVAIQTFGAYGANFNPHLHAIVSDGVFAPEGEFLPLPSLDTGAVGELFRRMLLARLHQAERLSERFRDQLLSWVHPGFSVFAGPAVEPTAVESLESQARYITRPALAMDALEKRDNATLAMQTPPDPRTGATMVVFDPLEWIHRITAHIPDPGQHNQRYYGAYSNRARVRAQAVQNLADPTAEAGRADQDSDFAKEARRTWARLLRKIFEVDPLLCRCGARMKIVSIITDPRIVDRIVQHRESERCQAPDPFESRAPPCNMALPLP